MLTLKFNNGNVYAVVCVVAVLCAAYQGMFGEAMANICKAYLKVLVKIIWWEIETLYIFLLSPIVDCMIYLWDELLASVYSEYSISPEWMLHLLVPIRWSYRDLCPGLIDPSRICLVCTSRPEVYACRT